MGETDENGAKEIQDTSFNFEAPQSINRQHFTKVLTQALVTSDKQLIESLIKCRDRHLIEDTVAELTPTTVLALLDYLCSNLVNSRSQIYTRDGWVTILVRRHCIYLSRNPKARVILEKLDRHIKQRLTAHQSLLKLKGKVDTLVYFAAMGNKRRKMDRQTRNLVSEPAVTYVEK